MKPQEPIPHNYSMGRLNAIFAASALGLLAVTGIIVGYDYVRGWKWFQWEFLRIQQERLESDLRGAQQEENKTQLAALDQQVKAQELEIAQHREQYVVAQRELDGWEGKHYAADQDYRFAKATLDANRYDLETAIVQHAGNLPARQKEYEGLASHVNDLQLRLQDVTRQREAARARVDVWLKRIKDAEDKKKELTASIDLIKNSWRASRRRGAFSSSTRRCSTSSRRRSRSIRWSCRTFLSTSTT